MADYSAFTSRLTDALLNQVLQEKDPVAHAVGEAIPELIHEAVQSKKNDNRNAAVKGLAEAIEIYKDLGYAQDSDEVKSLRKFYGLDD